MRLALPLTMLMFAGCVTPGALVGVPDTAAVFGEPLAMDQPSGGAEPNVAVAPDGTVWITAVAGSQERPNHEQGAAWLWRSKDGGATWDTLRAPQRDTPLGSTPGTRRPFGSSDADVVTSPDGWVYYTDWWNYGAPIAPPVALPLPVSPTSRYGSYLVEASGDNGVTWQRQSITTLDTFGGMDRQWLVAGPDGWVGLFYAYFHGPNPTRPDQAAGALDGASSIEAVYSSDHGATWTKPATVVAEDASAFSQIGHPRLTPQGLLWMPHAWATQQDGYWTEAGEVRVALSADKGATWTVVKVADVPGGFDNLWAVQGDSAPDGTMHVAWGARTGDNMTVFHASSADGGRTWSAPHALRAEGTNFLPWVAARAGGVAVSWYGSDATGDPSEADDSTEWWLYVAQLRDGAWSTTRASGAPVKTGPMCAKGGACAAERELLDYSGIGYGPDGRLHAAFATSRDLNGVKAGLVNYVGSLPST
ncbi:MAG TPA: sialidase family protein [Candidatus Thermoplasmatota archaeon]|nr:sialidase family protein [Candidatus Thermoplasmatota archaeon]